MKSILFLSHGNIYRSQMAGFVMKKLIAYAGCDDIKVEPVALYTNEF
jgi:protein-tyrosine-phosphatase